MFLFYLELFTDFRERCKSDEIYRRTQLDQFYGCISIWECKIFFTIKCWLWIYMKVIFICMQWSKGIRQWPINWYTSIMMIHKITSNVDYNKWLKGLDTQLNEANNHNSTKFPKLLNQRIRKRYHKTIWTSVINSIVPSLSFSLRYAWQTSVALKQHKTWDDFFAM